MGDNRLHKCLLLRFHSLHIQSDVSLGLGLGGEVRHRHVSAEAVSGQHLGNLQAGFLGVGNPIAHQAKYFLRSVERGSVGGDGIVPAPLALADVLECVVHFGFRGAIVPGIFGFDVGLGQDVFQLVADLEAFLLTFIDILAQRLLAFAVTDQTGAVHLRERALDMVVGVFHAAVGDPLSR